MNTIKKVFVEEKYTYSLFGKLINENRIYEVESRNTKDILKHKKVQCFRFFDQSFVYDNGKIEVLEKTNFSNWFYNGERLSLAKFKEKYQDVDDIEQTIEQLQSQGYEYVCETTSGNLFPLEKDDMTVEEYTENNPLRAKSEAIEMFNRLNKCLGRKVSCCIWNNDEINYIYGKLEEVNDFSNVVIGGQILELIGKDKGVINIKLDNNITLYKNSHIIGNNHHGLLYDVIIKKKMYGYDYCQKEWLDQEEKEKRKFNLERAKDILKLCNSECTSLNDERNHKGWESLVDKCVVDYDTYKIFNAASGMIKDLDNGICFNEAENRMHSRTPILSQLQVYEIAEIVVAFYQKGESYREYWQNSNDTLKKWVKQKIITGEKSKKCDDITNN